MRYEISPLHFVWLACILQGVQSSGLEDSEEENCTIISSEPRRRPSEATLDFIKLLDSPSHLTHSDDRVEEAVLILGNTGCGKTTLAQMITGDLNKLHLVLTQSRTSVIVDDDNRIGAPSTVSKTLFPELMWKEEESWGGRTAFYDCPGFDDTRGPEQDIVANLFMNQLTMSLSRVKLLFLVIHSSVRSGSERLDFDLLVGHATKFLKNVLAYRNSIGLVVTKVESYNGRGKYVSDETFFAQVKEFLQGYNATLHSQLETESGYSSKDWLIRKIHFVQILLEQDDRGKLARVAISRSPDECGPLSSSPIATNTRLKVGQLSFEKLEYVQINEQDFGYTLKDKTKLALGQYIRPLNEAVRKGIAAVINDFRNWYNMMYVRLEYDFTKITVRLRSSTGILSGLVSQLGNNSEPSSFFATMTPSLEKIGYVTSSKLKKFVDIQQEYFNFFDKANSARVARDGEVWLSQVEQLSNELADHRDWYEFCAGLWTELRKFQRQIDKPERVSVKGGRELLEFLRKEGDYPVPARIAELAIRLDPAHLEVLEKIVEFWLIPVAVRCENSAQGRVRVEGNFVKFSDFVSGSGKVSAACGKGTQTRHVQIYATHTLFIDVNLEGEGRHLKFVMMAPIVEVVGGDRYINLNGSPGESHDPPGALAGEYGTSGETLNGSDGLAGNPDGPAGSFFGLALEVSRSKHTLRVMASGGEGGPGQDGGRGGKGKAGEDPFSTNVMREPWWRVKLVKWQGPGYFGLGETDGYSGETGGSGGDGGVGGKSGFPGELFFLSRNQRPHRILLQTNNIRMSGTGGSGGQGGPGGDPSYSAECWCELGLDLVLTKISINAIVPIACCHHLPPKLGSGAGGKDGRANASTLGRIDAQVPANTIEEWESVLGFKYGVGSTRRMKATREFAKFLEEEDIVLDFFGVEGFVDELRRIFSHQDAAEFLPLYITRVGNYAREKSDEMDDEEKKVVAHLLASAHMELVTLEQKSGMGMVVDVAEYLRLVRGTMDKFKQSAALLVVEQTRKRSEEDLNAKVAVLKGFVDEAVRPALADSERELERMFRVFGREIEEGILENREKLEKFREKLLSKQILKVAGVVISLVSLVGGPLVASISTGVTTTIKLMEVVQGVVGDIEGALKPGVSTRENAVNLFGNETASNLFSRFGGGDDSARMKLLVEQTEMLLKDAYNRKVILEKSFTPILESILESVRKVAGNSENFTGELATLRRTQLGVRGWEMTGTLKGAKRLLGMMGRGMETGEFVRALDRVQDALGMMVQLVEKMEKHEDVRRLTGYLTDVISASIRNIHVNNPKLAFALAGMEEASLANTFWMEYLSALHAFKQWVFPFAKLHMTEELEERGERRSPELAIIQLDQLQSQLALFKVSTNGAQDTHLISRNFSSSHRSSAPFYVWRGKDYRQEMIDFLAGRPIHMKADARLSLPGRDAVKFKLIEINLKMPVKSESGRETQAMLNSELELFGVMMTHSGLSYYRFQGDFYVMMGVNQTIRYNFERDGATGNRLGTNQVYEKCKKGDYLLSPYTMWTIQLVEGLPSGGGRHGQSRESFRRLERFASVIDLELVGTGIYVDVGRLGEDLQVEKYYERDESIRNEIIF